MKFSSLSRPDLCVVYTTDQKYLFPTLVSAIQARRHASLDLADVVILCFGMDESAERVFHPICEAEGIILAGADYSQIEGQTAMMARFFLNRLLPEHYSGYLYLDGDVQILNSLDPLLEVTVPPGHFLAANDPMTFLLADSTPLSRTLSTHLRGLGLTSQQASEYFNSGVLRINADGWDSIGAQAWEYVRRLQLISRFPDQDALNVVAGNKRLPMSLTWNYPAFLRNSRVEATIRPRIKHFMSSPKPWQGAFPPWTWEACVPYIEALRQYPSLTPYSLRMALGQRMMYHLQQRSKQVAETLTWGWSKRRARILHYENSCLDRGSP